VISATGYAGQCGGADIRHAPAHSTTDDKPPGNRDVRCPGRKASPWSGRPRCPPYRLLPVLVHHWVSTRSGSSSGPVSSRPVSSRPVSDRRVSDRRVSSRLVSDRRVSGHLVPSSGTGLSGRLVPPVRRPAVWCPPVCPLASVRSRVSPPWPLDHAGPAGPSRLEWVGFRVACRVPERLRRPGRRRRCGGRGSTGRGGCRSRTWAGLRSGCGGGLAGPLTDREASLAWGSLVAGG
jgi:hypothetical protein